MGDLHVTEASEHRYRDIFAEISEVADVLVLCDLTNFGKTREAEILAEDLRACTILSVGVLGNHDYECGQPEEVAKILHSAGMTVLGEQAVIIHDVGFAGVKGFVGGFGRGELGAFGEPEIKSFVDAALEEARRLENALRSLKTERSVAVLHYAPVVDTVEGEPLNLSLPGLLPARRRGRPLRSRRRGRSRPCPSRPPPRAHAARHPGLQLRDDGHRRPSCPSPMR